MTRQTRVVEPIAEPSAEKELPHHYLRLGIPPAYRSHTTMALLLGQFVCHYLSPLTNIKWRQVSRLQTLILFNQSKSDTALLRTSMTGCVTALRYCYLPACRVFYLVFYKYANSVMCIIPCCWSICLVSCCL